jgi:hypothetical protein
MIFSAEGEDEEKKGVCARETASQAQRAWLAVSCS